MNATMRNLTSLLLIATALMLTSCSSVTRAVLPDHRLVAKVKTSSNLNLNDRGRPSPLVVYVFQLKETDAFNSAEFFDLYEKGKETLGQDFVAVSKFSLMPKTEAKFTLKLKPDVKYIGIVAGYHNLESTEWRKVVPLDSNWGREKVRFIFDAKGIKLDSVTKTGTNINVDELKSKKENLDSLISKQNDDSLDFEVIKSDK